MKQRQRFGIVCLVGALSTQAHAGTPFGEDNVQLAIIAGNTAREVTALETSIEYLKVASEYARDTAAFARESVQVARNVDTILHNPAEFLAYATRSWSAAFPELQDILANAASVRESMDAAMHPASMPLYDPYAYVRSFDRLHSMVGSGFEVWAHAIDTWGINEPHDEMIRTLQIQHDMALQNLERFAVALNTTGISPVQMSIYTAQATTVSAAAQIEAAATLHKLSRTAEQLLAGIGESTAEQQKNRHVEQEAAVRVYAPSWRLQPMKHSHKLHHEGR